MAVPQESTPINNMSMCIMATKDCQLYHSSLIWPWALLDKITACVMVILSGSTPSGHSHRQDSYLYHGCLSYMHLLVHLSI